MYKKSEKKHTKNGSNSFNSSDFGKDSLRIDNFEVLKNNIYIDFEQTVFRMNSTYSEKKNCRQKTYWSKLTKI